MVQQSPRVVPSIPLDSRILPRMFNHSMMLRIGIRYAIPGNKKNEVDGESSLFTSKNIGWLKWSILSYFLH